MARKSTREISVGQRRGTSPGTCGILSAADSAAPRLPPPTRTICDMAIKQKWEAALTRCQNHPEDMRYSNLSGSLLHFVLFSHRRRDSSAEHEEAFCRLLEQLMSFNPNMLFAVGSLGYTPLHIACSKDSLRSVCILELLLRRSVPPDVKELQKLLLDCYMPLDTSIPIDIVHHIYQFLPNAALMKDSQGKTPLFLTCQVSKNIPRREKKCTEALRGVAKSLCESAPEAKNIADKTGRTPIEVVRGQKKYLDLIGVLT